MKMQRTIRQAVGFTLIELMVVIAIIGILAAVAIPQYQTYAIRAKANDAVAAIRTAQIAIDEYAALNNTLPNDEDDLPAISYFGTDDANEPSNCSGLVKFIDWTRNDTTQTDADGNVTGVIVGSSGYLEVTYYSDNDEVDSACRATDVATENVDVPEPLSGNTVRFNVKIQGNGNLAWATDLIAANGTVPVKYRPGL